MCESYASDVYAEWTFSRFCGFFFVLFFLLFEFFSFSWIIDLFGSFGVIINNLFTRFSWRNCFIVWSLDSMCNQSFSSMSLNSASCLG